MDFVVSRHDARAAGYMNIGGRDVDSTVAIPIEGALPRFARTYGSLYDSRFNTRRCLKFSNDGDGNTTLLAYDFCRSPIATGSWRY